jgi:hypothetical protein
MFDNNNTETKVVNHPACFAVTVKVGEIVLNAQIPLDKRSTISFDTGAAGAGALKMIEEMSNKAAKLSKEYESYRAFPPVPVTLAVPIPEVPVAEVSVTTQNNEETDESNQAE